MSLEPGHYLVPPIVVRLARAVAARIPRQFQDDPPDTLEAVADGLGLADLAELVRARGLQSVPLVPREIVGFDRLIALEAEAAASAFPPLRTLTAYYLARLPWTEASEVGAVVAELRALDEVADAYPEPRAGPAASPPPTVTDPGFKLQGYLYGDHAAGSLESGVNAVAAGVFGVYTGNGNGLAAVGFADLEAGWRLGHEDFPKGLATAGPNGDGFLNPPFDNDDAESLHGTQALGAVIAQRNNALHIAGLAPDCEARGVFAVSRPVLDALGDPVIGTGGLPVRETNVTAALVAAADRLSAGDVLLVEMQNDDTDSPLETVDHWFDAIRLNAALGIVVIEPAGNGGLGTLSGVTKLTPGHPDFVDSGAIMVGGCERKPQSGGALVGHLWDAGTTQGPRIDCHAWSEQVYTTAFLTLPSYQEISANWGGTSAAASIIAGVAIVVQDMYRKTWSAGGSVASASPTQIRALLADWKLGTPILDSTKKATQIGTMPDLGEIAKAIGALPDVYVRDSLTDDGTIPSATTSQSPDIFIKHASGGAYGAGSPTENLIPANQDVRPNGDNYVFVRMKNRGGSDAVGVVARVFWAAAGTLTTPSTWTHIGNTAPTDVPAGAALTVATPLLWQPAGNVPPTGHGCLIAVLHHPSDPAPPDLPDNDPAAGVVVGWSDFIGYVGNNNNVGWRNFNVLTPGTSVAPVAGPQPEEALPFAEAAAGAGQGGDAAGGGDDAAGGRDSGTGGRGRPAEAEGATFEAAFYVRGAPDSVRRFAIEFLQSLPDGSRVEWEIPPDLARTLAESGLRTFDPRRGDRVVRLRIPARRVVRFPHVAFPAGAAWRTRILIVADPGRRPVVAVRQVWRDTEVGRVTYELAAAADESEAGGHTGFFRIARD